MKNQTQCYQEEAHQTEAPITPSIDARMVTNDMLRYMHGVLGVTSEAGELADIFKKHIYYGTPIDRVHVIEEMGDLLWYVALLANVVDINLEEVMAINIAKLRSRYPEMFTELDARNRCLSRERSVLEEGVNSAGSE